MSKAKSEKQVSEQTAGEPALSTNSHGEKIVPSSVLPAPDPGAKANDTVKLAFGEVLFSAIDADGNEVGELMKASESTFRRYYSDETKYKLVKKSS